MISIVQPATVGDYLAFYAVPSTGWVLWHGGERIGMAGLAMNQAENRHWAYFDLRGGMDAQAGASLTRKVWTTLRAIKLDVWCLCQKDTFPQAPRFLRVLGFKPTGEIREQQEVWLWQQPQ